jgi:hypothetical protein
MGRRVATTAVTLLVLCAIVAGGAYWGWKQLTAPIPGPEARADAPSAPCTPRSMRPGDVLTTKQVRVSVHNAGTRSGLADSTMAQLRKRGFRPGAVGNAPSGLRVPRVQVRTARQDNAAARLVALQFGRQVPLRVVKGSLGPGVDVVVGNDFRRLSTAPRQVRVVKAQRVCIARGK